MMHTENDLAHMADSMGISLYQRFSVQEASLFLRISIDAVKKLIKQHQISYIQVSQTQVDFFGYQLLEHLHSSIRDNSLPVKPSETSETEKNTDRILRAQEVQTMTGLSRTTIWRLENKGQFPRRVSLGGNRVGWKSSDVAKWIDERV